MELSITQQLELLEKNGAAAHRQRVSLLYLVVSAGLFMTSLYSSNLGLFIGSALMLWVRHIELQAAIHLSDACKSLHENESIECDIEISEYCDDECGLHYCAHINGMNLDCRPTFEFNPDGWQPEVGHDKAHAYFKPNADCPSLLITAKGLIIPS